MKLTDAYLLELSQVACEAARQAGELIASYAHKPIEVCLKEGGDHLASKVVTEVDRKSESLILDRLQPSITRYDLALLSEEREDDRQRLVKDYFWCIDPLDGTLAFTESTPGYAVSIALVSRDGAPLIGIIYDPVTATLYSAVKGHGAFRNNLRWMFSGAHGANKFTLPCDRSLAERNDYSTLIHVLESWAVGQGLSGVETIHKGGAVMNACQVLENTPACYFKPPKSQEGGGSLWDFAATACLFNELGAIACDFHGRELDLNRSDSTFMNHRGVIFASDQKTMNSIRSIWKDGLGLTIERGSS